MISTLTQKLVHTFQVVQDKKKCLRYRLRGYSCQRCVEGCGQKAIEVISGQIIFNPDACTGCGICVALCPSDSFSFEGFALTTILHEKVYEEKCIVSCPRSTFKAVNELKIPCVGVLPPEALILLGLKNGGDIVFNLSECSGCINRVAADFFAGIFRLVQERCGHLFKSLLAIADTIADLPNSREPDRRQFLFSIGGNVADMIHDHFTPTSVNTQKPVGTRQIPMRIQLLQELFYQDRAIFEELVEMCAPDAKILSSCTRCPRCVGMCPTGALKRRKDGSEKVLSYDRTLCSACGLCVEFCKEGAISIRDADLISTTPLYAKEPASN